MKFKAAVRECHMVLHRTIEWAESESQSITDDMIEEEYEQEGVQAAMSLYTRLLRENKGEAWQLTQQIAEWLEVWGALPRRYKANTPMLMIKVMNLSARTDCPGEHRTVGERVPHARAGFRRGDLGPHENRGVVQDGVGGVAAGHLADEWPEPDGVEIAAVGKGLCFPCGRQGHRAAKCAAAPPYEERGNREKGKGEGFGGKSKGKSAGKGRARQQRPHCGKVGHGASAC